MRAWLTTKFGYWPRYPLAGVALAAMAGVGLAEAWRVWLIPGQDEVGNAPWIAAGVFLMFGAGWTWRRRPVWLWGAIVAGYASLHLFSAAPLPAMTLDRVLSLPVGAIATGNDPNHATAHVLRATGTVVDLPRLIPAPPGLPASQQAGPTWRFVLRLESAEADGIRWPCHAAVTAQWRDAVSTLSPGDRLEITALAENARPPRNPGEFDYAGHLRRQGILSSVRIAGVADGHILPTPSGLGHYFSVTPLRRFAGRCHAWMSDTLRLDIDDDSEASAIVSTTLLGLSDQPELGELESVFQRTGTLHYFAVDGLKLGLVSFLLLRALSSLGLPRPWPGALVLPLLLGYVFATGLSVAGVRALIFAFVIVGGELADRPARPLNSLGAAAATVLLLDTQSLFALGFQLTFFDMLVILLLVGEFNQRLRQLGAPDPFLPVPLYSRTLHAWEWARRGACELTALSIAAWLGSLPIMLLTFHLFSPISLVANVVTFPLAFIVLALGVLSMATGGFSTALSVWFNNANWLCAKVFLWLVRMFDLLPGGSVAVASPSHWHWPAPAAELTVYDFERGRAASLRAGGSDWLIDAARLTEYSTGVLPCLRAQAVERLNGGLLLTQADADHLAAARLAVEDLHPARIIASARANRSPLLRDFHGFLGAQGRKETLCRWGDVLPLGDGASATVLYPPEDLSGKFRSAADRALALRIEASGWRMVMFTEGDGAAARWLTEHDVSGGLEGAVLVTSAPVSPKLLDAVKPRLVLLRSPIVKGSGGAGKETLRSGELSVPATIAVLDQHECGAVTLLVYPDRLEAIGFVGGGRLILKK